MPAMFQIERRNHFDLLFRRKKNPWKIKCTDDLLLHKLQTILRTSGIDDLADQEAFEPTITGEVIDGSYSIHAIYSIAFNRKEESIMPMINFFKQLIDKIQKL